MWCYDGVNQVINDLAAFLIASLVYILELLFGVLVGVILSLLVSAFLLFKSVCEERTVGMIDLPLIRIS